MAASPNARPRKEGGEGGRGVPGGPGASGAAVSLSLQPALPPSLQLGSRGRRTPVCRALAAVGKFWVKLAPGVSCPRLRQSSLELVLTVIFQEPKDRI